MQKTHWHPPEVFCGVRPALAVGVVGTVPPSRARHRQAECQVVQVLSRSLLLAPGGAALGDLFLWHFII